MRRWVRRTAIALLVCSAIAVVAGGLFRVRIDTSAASFLSMSNPTQRATSAVAQSFGGDPIVVLLEAKKSRQLLEGTQLDRLIGLEGDLAKLSNVAVVYGPGTLLNQIAGQGQDFLATISGARDALSVRTTAEAKAAGQSPAQVKRTVAAALRAFDLRYVSLLVQALPVGLPTLSSPTFVQNIVFDSSGKTRPTWRFLVPTANSVALIVRPRGQLDQDSTDRLVTAIRSVVAKAGLPTARITITGSPVIAAGLGLQLRSDLPVIAALALILVAACYFFLPWLPRRRRRVIPVLVTLAATTIALAVFGWLSEPLSLGVVAFLPILLGTGSDFPAYLTRGVDARKVTVTALAAVAGFGALAISPVPFVRQLGIALALGVALAVGLGWVAARLMRVQPEVAPAVAGVAGVAEGSRPVEEARPVRTAPATRRFVLLGVAGAIALTGWILLPQLRIDADPMSLAKGAPVLTDAQHAEKILGTSGEVDLLVRGKELMTPDVLRWMEQVQDVLNQRFSGQARQILSPAAVFGFLGSSPTQAQIDAGIAQIPAYLRDATVTADGHAAVFSMGIVGDDVAHQEAVISAIRQAIPTPPTGVSVQMAGIPAITGRAYSAVSSDRYPDALGGVAAAGVVLLLGLRRRGDVVRALSAALLSAGFGLFGAYVLGVGLTPLTVALGSLATATACEFTVLLGSGGGSHGTRRAVLVAASAATCGYLSLSLSDLSVIRSFGLFLAATVVLSLGAAALVRYALPVRPRPAERAAGGAPAGTSVGVLGGVPAEVSAEGNACERVVILS
jgi:predicted RND superfamily exporter protein